MLMHTRAFGDYEGPEEVMLRTNNFTEINLIDNYGSTSKIDFKIVDKEGKPVDNAKVDFKIYNYAEFYTAVSKYTGTDGTTFLSAGKGDMIVWASRMDSLALLKLPLEKISQSPSNWTITSKICQRRQTSISFHLLQIQHYLPLPRHRGMKIRVV